MLMEVWTISSDYFAELKHLDIFMMQSRVIIKKLMKKSEKCNLKLKNWNGKMPALPLLIKRFTISTMWSQCCSKESKLQIFSSVGNESKPWKSCMEKDRLSKRFTKWTRPLRNSNYLYKKVVWRVAKGGTLKYFRQWMNINSFPSLLMICDCCV